MEIRPEFDHIVLNEEGQAKSRALRERFSELLDAVEATAGAGREAALARTALQEAAYWAQKAVALTAKYTKALAWFFVGAVTLGALPAFAQEAAPSVQAENWMQALLGFVFTGLLFPLGKKLVEWVGAQTEGKAYENASRAVLDIIEGRAVWLHQRLSEAAADGKVTREEFEAIASELAAQLPAQTLNALRSHIGVGVVSWIASTLADRVTARGRAQTAAIAAIATVPNVEAAKASPVWK